MTVRELKDQLETFNDDMEVVIGMQQTYGINFAMEIKIILMNIMLQLLVVKIVGRL